MRPGTRSSDTRANMDFNASFVHDRRRRFYPPVRRIVRCGSVTDAETLIGIISVEADDSGKCKFTLPDGVTACGPNS